MVSLARILVTLGILLLIAGAIVALLARFGVTFGNLPGDIHWQHKNVSVYFPLGTCIVLSILLTLVLYLLARFKH